MDTIIPAASVDDTVLEATRGALRFQGFCRQHVEKLRFLGYNYGKYRVAATPAGTKILSNAGFEGKATGETTPSGLKVYSVRRRVKP